MLLEHYANVHIDRYEDQDDLPIIPDEAGLHAPYANAAGHVSLMRQHWGYEKTWNLFKSKADPNSFETIIRVRPDQWIHSFDPPRQPEPDECFSPWWGKFGGVNDRVGVMGPVAAIAYFGVYRKIVRFLKAGCPFHPETLLKASLQAENIIIHHSLMVEASTMRLDGSQRWPEMSIIDLRH